MYLYMIAWVIVDRLAIYYNNIIRKYNELAKMVEASSLCFYTILTIKFYEKIK
jgi:hypothetical protein